MYKISYSRKAAKAISRMDRKSAELIKGKIDQLAQSPESMSNVKRLSGMEGYRLRVGDWRVVYTLEEARLIIAVVDIGSRGGIYK